jgi:hypothetical protein
VIQTAEVACNGRQRSGDEGRVERSHQQDKHQTRENKGETSTVELPRSVQFGQPTLRSRSGDRFEVSHTLPEYLSSELFN